VTCIACGVHLAGDPASSLHAAGCALASPPTRGTIDLVTPAGGTPSAPRYPATSAALARTEGAVGLGPRWLAGWGRSGEIVVTRRGVWIVGARRPHGQRIESRPAGLRHRGSRLLVGGRDRSRVVEVLAGQTAELAAILDGLLPPAMVRAVLSLEDAVWPFRGRPFVVAGVAVCWPRALPALIGGPGPLDPWDVGCASVLLGEALPAAP
jgi:hypothetical protein